MRTRFIKKSGEKVFALACRANASTKKVSKFFDDYKKSAGLRVIFAEMRNDYYFA